MMRKGAVLSFDEQYRYTLTRWWHPNPTWVVFIGLNPSTADAIDDDPTIRRCIDFTRRWGYSGLVMLNLFAYRATSPADMKRVEDPVGPNNDKWLMDHKGYQPIIAMWGNHGRFRGRDEVVTRLIPGMDCFGFTKQGCPRHLLYLPKTAEAYYSVPTETPEEKEKK